MAKGNGSGLSSRMKAVGRNMARVELQKSGQKFAGGGAVLPKMPGMGDMGAGGMNQSPSGMSKARGGGRAVKGTNFRGSF